MAWINTISDLRNRLKSLGWEYVCMDEVMDGNRWALQVRVVVRHYNPFDDEVDKSVIVEIPGVVTVASEKVNGPWLIDQICGQLELEDGV